MSKVITPKAVLSYPHLFEPRAQVEGAKPKYSCALVFPDGTDLSAIEEVVDAVGADKWGTKYAAMKKSGACRSPLRDDGEAKGYGEGSVFMNVKNDSQPGIVSIYPDANGKPKRIDDPSEIYAGCWVKASLRAYAYDTNGNRGISFALNNIQKVADGRRIDGRSRAEDEFEADPNAAADMDLGDEIDRL